MNLEEKLKLIESEISVIEKHKEKISSLYEDINEFNPFEIGQQLNGNGYSHRGKPFVVERTFASYGDIKAWAMSQERAPRFFVAAGSVIKKSGDKGHQEVWHTAHIVDVMQAYKDNKQ